MEKGLSPQTTAVSLNIKTGLVFIGAVGPLTVPGIFIVQVAP